jgi:hypothetical protein
MAQIQTRGSLADLGKVGLGPQFEDVFEQNLLKYDGMTNISRIVSYINTEKSVLRTTGLSGYGFLEEFEEGDALPQDGNVKTFETQYAIRDYGKMVTVTDDCIEDREKLGAKLGEMANHAKSANVTRAKAGLQPLNGGFITTAKVNGFSLHRYNNERLFSTSHARADGGTAQSNASASGIVLSEVNLETGRLALVKQLTDNGMPILDMGRIILVVPDDLEKNAYIITGSQLRATTTNNDLNYYRGRIDVLSARWLNANNGGSSTAWFLLATLPGQNLPLRVYQKGGPRFKEGYENKTWNQEFGVKDRFAVGHTEWKGTWGSLGDTIAFAG